MLTRSRITLAISVLALLATAPLSVVRPFTAELTNVLTAEASVLCGGPFDDAKATVFIRQSHGQTRMKLTVRDAAPNMAYSVWVKLADMSPLTGLPFTAAANPDEMTELATITPSDQLLSTELGAGDDGSGGETAVNGFYTDANGDGELTLALDFPLIRGAYQFQEATSFPVQAVGDDPFIIAVASHCTDNRFHGLAPGVFELWWRMEVAPF